MTYLFAKTISRLCEQGAIWYVKSEAILNGSMQIWQFNNGLTEIAASLNASRNDEGGATHITDVRDDKRKIATSKNN